VQRRALLAIFAGVLAGCAALLSLDDVSYRGPDGGLAGDASASDASASDVTDPDATARDSSVGDDACSADLSGDPNHCGMCGRACAACEGGLCAPELVMSGLLFPSDLAAGDSGVFAAAVDGVFTCVAPPCADAAVPYLRADYDGGEFLAGVALADERIIAAIATVNTGGTVARVLACGAGDCASPSTLAVLQQDVSGLSVVGANDVAWGRGATLVGQSEVARCPLLGCSDGGPWASSSFGGAPVHAIVAAGSTLYVTAGNRLVEIPATGIPVLRAGIGSSDQARKKPVVVEGPRLIWGNPETRTLDTCLAANCLASRLTWVANAGEPHSLLVDGPYAYWTADGRTADGGTEALLYRCPLADGTRSVVLARRGAQAVGLAIRGPHVYWSEPVTGNVWRIPK
jgi:hypothetical protein